MKKGFTLIELLIVVAIIAILAAIAVPNFLEAQTRAKVSRTMADMRSMATALETYRIDTNAYPSCAGSGYQSGGTPIWRAYGNGATADPPALYTIGFELSTPISYLSGLSAFVDPFKASKREFYIGLGPSYKGREMYAFYNSKAMINAVSAAGTKAALTTKMDKYGQFLLASAGPDGWVNNGWGAQNDYRTENNAGAASFPYGGLYDATNGTVSQGDISRSDKYPAGLVY